MKSWTNILVILASLIYNYRVVGVSDEEYRANSDGKSGAEYEKSRNRDAQRNIEQFEYNDDEGSYGRYRSKSDFELVRDVSKYDDETRNKMDDIFGYTGPTANDDPENLLRPCALQDWQCIRKFFAANGQCEPVYGPIPDPLVVDVSTVYFTVVNLTVNKKSGNLVFAIDIQNLNLTAPLGYLRYRRTAKESIILGDFQTVEFRSVTITSVIPKIPNLRLENADIHADSQDGTPSFAFGPRAFSSPDPDVISAFALFAVNLPIAVREGFLFHSNLMMAVYIQTNICDFGLKIASV